MEFLAQFHPKVIHFPIALFLTYTLLEIVGGIFKKQNFSTAAYIILILGVLSSVAAVLTGNQAEEVWPKWPDGSEIVVETHELYATITLWYFVAVLLLRTFFVINVEIKNKFEKFKYSAKYVFIALALIGCYFIYQTGEHGGEMVYKYGIGVKVQKTNTSNDND